jgi:hypothetical protein
MRKIFNEQLKIGAAEIGKIEIDLKSRDQIPKVLLGLQYIYTHEEIRKSVFNSGEYSIISSFNRSYENYKICICIMFNLCVIIQYR